MANFYASQSFLYDTFTRADNATTPGNLESGEAWVLENNTNDAVAGIYNNQLYAVSDGASDRVYVGVDLADLELDINFDYTFSSTGEQTGFNFLTDTFDQASRNGYCFQYTSSSSMFRMLIINAGTPTTMSSTTTYDTSIVAGSTFHVRLTVHNSVLTYQVNDNAPVSKTLTTHNTAEHTVSFWDFRKYGTSAVGSKVDNFTVDKLGITSGLGVGMSVTGVNSTGGEAKEGTVDFGEGIGQTAVGSKQAAGSVSGSHGIGLAVASNKVGSGSGSIALGIGQTIVYAKRLFTEVAMSYPDNVAAAGFKASAKGTSFSLGIALNVAAAKQGSVSGSVAAGIGLQVAGHKAVAGSGSLTHGVSVSGIGNKTGIRTISITHGVGLTLASHKGQAATGSLSIGVQVAATGNKATSGVIGIGQGIGQTLSYSIDNIIRKEGTVAVVEGIGQTVIGQKNVGGLGSIAAGVGLIVSGLKTGRFTVVLTLNDEVQGLGIKKASGAIGFSLGIGQALSYTLDNVIDKEGTVDFGEGIGLAVIGHKVSSGVISTSLPVAAAVQGQKGSSAVIGIGEGIGQTLNYTISIVIEKFGTVAVVEGIGQTVIWEKEARGPPLLIGEGIGINVSSLKKATASIAVSIGSGQTLNYTTDKVIRRSGTVAISNSSAIVVSGTKQAILGVLIGVNVNTLAVGEKAAAGSVSASQSITQTLKYNLGLSGITTQIFRSTFTRKPFACMVRENRPYTDLVIRNGQQEIVVMRKAAAITVIRGNIFSGVVKND